MLGRTALGHGIPPDYGVAVRQAASSSWGPLATPVRDTRNSVRERRLGNPIPLLSASEVADGRNVHQSTPYAFMLMSIRTTAGPKSSQNTNGTAIAKLSHRTLVTARRSAAISAYQSAAS